jgi:hypothetical protein
MTTGRQRALRDEALDFVARTVEHAHPDRLGEIMSRHSYARAHTWQDDFYAPADMKR